MMYETLSFEGHSVRNLRNQIIKYEAIKDHQFSPFRHLAVYEDGTYCKDHKKSRSAKILLLCDPDEQKEFVIAEGAETDFCEYLFKIKTRYMCPSGRRLRKASSHIMKSPHNEGKDLPSDWR